MMRARTRQVADWLARHEPWAVLTLSPWLLFPRAVRPLTIASLAFLPLLWLIRRLSGRPATVSTPLNVPLLLLLTCLGPAVLVSPLPDNSIAVATTFLLGIGLYMAIVNSEGQWRRPESAGGLLTAAGILLALSALVLTDWGPTKIEALGKLTERLPLLVPTASGSSTGIVLHPDQVGGMMAVLLPVVFSFTLLSRNRGRQPLMDRWYAVAWVSAAGGLLMFLLLLLSQARTSLLALLFVAAVVAGTRWRPARVVVLALMIVAGLLLTIGLVSGNLGDWLTSADDVTRSAGTEPDSWPQRTESWRNALLVMRDYPVVGAGLGTFEDVARLNYGFDSVSPGDELRNANNLWLQVGSDFGLVGFVGFAWLTLVLLLLGWAVLRRRGEERILLTGIWLGLVVWLGHGVTNALSLGTGSATVIWLMMAFLVAAWQGDEQPPAQKAPRSGKTARGRWPSLLAVYLLATLAAILVSQSPIWSLNRGANLLDGVLLSDSGTAAVDGNRAQLARASSLINAAADLNGALRRRALVSYELGDDTQAITLLRQDDESEGYLVSRARQFLADGELVEAERFLQMARQVVPGSGRLVCLMGDVCRLDDRPYDALTFYRQVPEMSASFGGRNARLAECMYQLGASERWLGNWGAAADGLGVASQLNPTESAYRVEYGSAVFRSTGDINQAASIIESVLESNPDDLHVMLVLADMYLQAERPQRSLEWSERAVGLEPSEPAPWLRVAQAYWAVEQEDQARQALAEVLTLDPTNEVALSLQAAWNSQ